MSVAGTGTECEIQELIGTGSGTGTDNIVQVGPPYNPTIIGPPIPPINLKLLLALIDDRKWPLQVCGDAGIGVNATPWGAVDLTINEYTKIDEGPVPDTILPAEPPNYPNVGITAHACQINCDYIIVGNLGADVIVGKIDGQWHILRVTGSASTIPLTGPSNNCRCCGNSLKGARLRAKIIEIIPPECDSPYPLCTEFRLDPISANAGLNPLSISLSCSSTPSSAFEDINDWQAFACGAEAEVISLKCCSEYTGCTPGTGSGSGTDVGTGTIGTGSAPCRFEAIIQTQVTVDCACSYKILIYPEESDGDPCVRFDDVPIDTVTAEACGLDNLTVGTRVILVRIPGGVPGREALDGIEPIEWFVVRACSAQDCAEPCDEGTPVGPPCCGKLCSEHPNTLTATIEMIAGDLDNCTTPVVIQLSKWNGSPGACNEAADTRWNLITPVPDNTLCAGFNNDPDPGPFPTWLDIETMELTCGEGASEETCAEAVGTGTAMTDGPPMGLTMSGGLEAGLVNATQNLKASCCEPLYLEYEITGQFGMVGGAGTPPAIVTLRITITP